MFALALLGLAATSDAATTTYAITNGRMGEVEHSCSWITTVFTNQDCTYGNTTVGLNPAGTVWSGPTRQGGYYPVGSAGDSLTFNPNDSTPGALPATPDAFKIKPVVVGRVVIDDNNTPAVGTDDTVLLAFSIQGPTATAGIVRSLTTGQFTQALQRWQSMDHTMVVPYPVDQAIPNANGGFDYVIGSRGAPTRLCRALNPGVDDSFDPEDCFPTHNYDKDSVQPATPAWWAPRPAPGSVGIERSRKLGIKAGPGPEPAPQGAEVPNIGLQTVATFTGYSCEHNNQASDDCSISALVWNTAEDPGFDNMVGTISTGSNAITAAQLYWTQEYFIGAFGASPALGDNSFQASEITFTGVSTTIEPTAVDDEFTVVAGTSTNRLDVLANDQDFEPVPATTVTIVQFPAQGLATVNLDGTINYNAYGVPAGTVTFSYAACLGAVCDTALVTVTVEAVVPPAISLLSPAVPQLTPSAGGTVLELFGDFTGFSMLGGGVDFAVNGPAAIIGFTPSPFLLGLDPAFTGWGTEFADNDFEVHLGSFGGFTGMNKLGDLALAFTGIEYGPVQIDLSINTIFGGFFTTDGNPIAVALQGAAFSVVPDAPTLVLPGTVTAAEAAAGTVVAGTVAPGLAVQVNLNGVSKTVVSDGAGAWSVSFGLDELPGDGAQPVEAFAFDDSGNFSAAATGEVLFNIAATAGLAIDPIAGDDIVNAAERAAGVVLSGTAAPGAPVTVTAGGQQWTTTAVANPIFADAFDGPVEEGLPRWETNGALVAFPAPGSAPQSPGGGTNVAYVEFQWANDGLARAWTSSAPNNMAALSNDTYFSSLAGFNSTSYYNPDFARAGDTLGWCGPGTEAFQAQYACKISTTTPVADIGPGARAAGQLVVTDTTLTGTLTVFTTNDEGAGPQPGTIVASGYNIRSADGSPFKNVWYGVSNQMQLTVNLTGTFSGSSWQINGGTVAFFDPSFQCAVSDFSGVLCNPSPVGGGFRPNGQALSWGMDQGTGAGTGVSQISVFDPTGDTQLATLAGVLASLSIDPAGNITTIQGEARVASGSAGGGCSTSIRYNEAADSITCGILQVSRLEITGTTGAPPDPFVCVGGAGGCVALNVSGGTSGRIVSVQDVIFAPGRQYVLEALVAGTAQGSGIGGVVLGLVDAATGELVRSEAFPGIVPGQPFATYSTSWFGSDLPPGAYRLFVAADPTATNGIVVDDVSLRDATVPPGGQPDIGYWSVLLASDAIPVDGDYDVVAALGSVASVARSFTVAATPPPVPQVQVLDSRGNLELSPVPPDVTRQISVNDVPVDEYQPPTADGSYVVRVCDRDAAGNESCTEVQFVVDLSPLPADDTAEVIAGQTVAVAVLANDDIQRTPVTVAVTQGPALGSAVVTGSPGEPAAIAVQYTAPVTLPAGPLLVADTFVYEVSDGVTGRTATVTVSVARDTDGDGVPDYQDNCVNVANADQRDTRDSGIGNLCNGDLKNKGITPNFEDLALFRSRFASADAEADFDGNGAVNFADLAIFRQLFAKPLPPPLPRALPAGFAAQAGQTGAIDIAQIPGVRAANSVVTVSPPALGVASVSGTTVNFSPGVDAAIGPVALEYTITDALGRFSTAVLTADVVAPGGGGGPSGTANVTFAWATAGTAVGWISAAPNSLASVANGTYFSSLAGFNQTTYYNPAFAKAGDASGWCGPGLEEFQAQYACRAGGNSPVADVGPGAQATGTLTVTPTTLTGTLTVVSTNDEGAGPQPGTAEATGYNVRFAEGSPFKNVWYGVSNQMTLAVNLTGTFTDTSWQITGGTVGFFDPGFQCAFADFSGVLCNPSTVAGGFRPNGQALSWGMDQAAGAGTPVGPIPVFDSTGSTLLETLSGVLAAVSIDANGTITTTQGEVRSATGAAASGCPMSIRYSESGAAIACGTLQAAPLVITGTVAP